MLNKNLYICSLFFFVCSFHAVASTTSSILEQCQKPLVTKITFNVSQSTLANIVDLERAMLALENQKDIVDYYLQIIYDKKREQFIACRILLMKQQYELFQLLNEQKWYEQLSKSKQPEAQTYIKALKILRLQHIDLEQQKKLLSARANYNISIHTSTQKIALPTTCRLQVENSHISQKDIFHYLLKQNNEDCRHKVWATYQQRSGEQASQAKKAL